MIKQFFLNIINTIGLFFHIIKIYVRSFINRHFKHQMISDKGIKAIQFVNKYLFSPYDKDHFDYADTMIYNLMVEGYFAAKELGYPGDFKQYLMMQAIILLERTPPDTVFETEFEIDPNYVKEIPEPEVK